MAAIQHYKTLADLHAGNGWAPPEHPLFSMVGCLSNCPLGDREFTSDCYMIGFKKMKSGVIMYGRTKYDHSNGSMMFVKPRQIIQMHNLKLEEKGFMILFHEDFLKGHALHKLISNYGFFDYEVNEALHLSPKEETTIWDLHDKMLAESSNNHDEYSREIILSHLGSVLMYAQRFYKRQFVNRVEVSTKTATRFNKVLEMYYKEGGRLERGLPSVHELAQQLFLSPRYLSDVLKQETGKTALELIHISLVSEAKNLLRLDEKGVAEIAYELGFENSSYFTRLFKKQTGYRPLEYRKMQLN